jgi:hypothetical protein
MQKVQAVQHTRSTGHGFGVGGVGRCPWEGIGTNVRSGRDVAGNGDGRVTACGRGCIYGQNRSRGVGKWGKMGSVRHVVLLLQMMVVGAEFVKEVFFGVFLQSLRKEPCSE